MKPIVKKTRTGAIRVILFVGLIFIFSDSIAQFPNGDWRFSQYQLLSSDRTVGLNYTPGTGRPPLSLSSGSSASRIIFEPIPNSQNFAVKLLSNTGQSAYLGVDVSDMLFTNPTHDPFLYHNPNDAEDIKYMWKVRKIGGDQLELAHPLTKTRSNHAGYQTYQVVCKMPSEMRYPDPGLNLIVGVLRQGTAMLYRAKDNRSTPEQINYGEGLWILQLAGKDNGITEANKFVQNSWQYTHEGKQFFFSVNALDGGYWASYKPGGYAETPRLIRSFSTAQNGVNFQFGVGPNQSMQIEIYKTPEGVVMGKITEYNISPGGPKIVNLIPENATTADLQSAVQRRDMATVNMMISKGITTDV